MSVLERVYNTFSHLDRDYARSKKTRTEFITDKFGGDINTGAIIILDAIRAEGMEETPDNIAKMSFIKDTFTSIQANAAHLDSLNSFSFADTSVVTAFMEVLNWSAAHETGQRLTTQSQLWNGNPKSIHYMCTPDGTQYVDPDACQVFQAYNENIAGLIGGVYKVDGELQLGRYYKLMPGRRLKPIAAEAVNRNLKG